MGVQCTSSQSQRKTIIFDHWVFHYDTSRFHWRQLSPNNIDSSKKLRWFDWMERISNQQNYSSKSCINNYSWIEWDRPTRFSLQEWHSSNVESWDFEKFTILSICRWKSRTSSVPNSKFDSTDLQDHSSVDVIQNKLNMNIYIHILFFQLSLAISPEGIFKVE